MTPVRCRLFGHDWMPKPRPSFPDYEGCSRCGASRTAGGVRITAWCVGCDRAMTADSPVVVSHGQRGTNVGPYCTFDCAVENTADDDTAEFTIVAWQAVRRA